MHGAAIRTRRHIDIAFMSGRTPRRERFIAGAGGMLWEWRTDLRFFNWHRPILADQPPDQSSGETGFVAGDAKFAALADTRILLNVHRGDEPYFEWARVVEAIANGCVVASENSVRHRAARPRRALPDGAHRSPRRASHRPCLR